MKQGWIVRRVIRHLVEVEADGRYLDAANLEVMLEHMQRIHHQLGELLEQKKRDEYLGDLNKHWKGLRH